MGLNTMNNIYPQLYKAFSFIWLMGLFWPSGLMLQLFPFETIV